MNIFLLRHAESNGNATGDYSTAAHDNLSSQGRFQAQALVRNLALFQFDRIFCSPLGRAVQTIIPYAEHGNHTVHVWPETAEACWQSGDGTGAEKYFFEEIPSSEKFPPFFVFPDDRKIRPVGNENFAQGLCRIAHVVRQLEKITCNSILLVSHGHFMSRLVELFLGCEPAGRFQFDNAGLSLVSVEGDAVVVRYVNRPFGI